jgi:hypothetical protein
MLVISFLQEDVKVFLNIFFGFEVVDNVKFCCLQQFFGFCNILLLCGLLAAAEQYIYSPAETGEGRKTKPKEDRTLRIVSNEGLPPCERDLYKLSLPLFVSPAILDIPRARATSPIAVMISSVFPILKTSSRYKAMSFSVSRYSTGSHTVVFTDFMLCLLVKVCRYLSCGCYIPSLGGLVASAKQYHNFFTPPGEVHPVAGAVIDAQFGNAASDRLGVAEVADGNTADMGIDNLLGLAVSKRPYPRLKVFGLTNYRHAFSVSHGIRKVKRILDYFSDFWGVPSGPPSLIIPKII